MYSIKKRVFTRWPFLLRVLPKKQAQFWALVLWEERNLK